MSNRGSKPTTHGDAFLLIAEIRRLQNEGKIVAMVGDSPGEGLDSNRDFFIFTIPTLTETLIGAQMLVYNPDNGYESPDASETFHATDVSTPI